MEDGDGCEKDMRSEWSQEEIRGIMVGGEETVPADNGSSSRYGWLFTVPYSGRSSPRGSTSQHSRQETGSRGLDGQQCLDLDPDGKVSRAVRRMMACPRSDSHGGKRVGFTKSIHSTSSILERMDRIGGIRMREIYMYVRKGSGGTMSSRPRIEARPAVNRQPTKKKKNLPSSSKNGVSVNQEGLGCREAQNVHPFQGVRTTNQENNKREWRVEDTGQIVKIASRQPSADQNQTN